MIQWFFIKEGAIMQTIIKENYMQLNKMIFATAMMAGLVAVLSAPLKSQAASDYSACNALNDFLSYSKCVAEIDSQKNSQPLVLVEDVKSSEGAFSLVVGSGSGVASALDVVLNLQASAETDSVAIAKDSNFGFAERQSFSAKKLWRLQETTGTTQYVYVKFFDKDGIALKTLAAAVIYRPRQVNEAAETAAKTQFAKLYNRPWGAANQFDNLWLEIAAYGWDKNAARDVGKEQGALAKFVAANKKTPQNEREWSYVHAVAYTPNTNETTTVNTAAASAANSAACFLSPIKRVLDIGSKGDDVKALQAVLQCAGYLPSTAKLDGVFDKTAETAVSKFQEKYGLLCANGVYCGRVGPSTAKQLSAVYPVAPAAGQVAGVKTENVAAGSVVLKLGRSLTLGSQGTDVSDLQKFLALDKELYPEGRVTGTFGPLTEAAVKRFQTKHNLLCKDGSACGYVGPATIKKLQEIAGS